MMTSKNRILKWTLILFAALTQVSCKKDSLKDCDEHTKATCQEDASKTNIRIKNNSKYDFCNVSIDPYDELTNYGIVKSGETTCYRVFDLAYNYAFVQFKIGDKEFTFFATDYVGEEPLGVGKFTYTIDNIDLEKKNLTISTTKD